MCTYLINSNLFRIKERKKYTLLIFFLRKLFQVDLQEKNVYMANSHDAAHFLPPHDIVNKCFNEYMILKIINKIFYFVLYQYLL